ncbi:MAG TPA: low molecular weight protein-tyrosine-phosphatase [Polyangiaceae bacterium]|jgi:protein-tyrosine phosphatase
MVRVCFVCLGNICRSPIGEGVLRHLVAEAGLAEQIEIDSAGTAGYHEGDPPDARARAAGKRRGIAIGGRARQFRSADFERFDYVLAMDQANLRDLLDLQRARKNGQAPLLLRSFDAESPPGASVPDPYYGGHEGFDEVLELCLRACAPLLAQIRREHGL